LDSDLKVVRLIAWGGKSLRKKFPSSRGLKQNFTIYGYKNIPYKSHTSNMLDGYANQPLEKKFYWAFWG
jgi:hypothetical protein